MFSELVGGICDGVWNNKSCKFVLLAKPPLKPNFISTKNFLVSVMEQEIIDYDRILECIDLIQTMPDEFIKVAKLHNIEIIYGKNTDT